MPHASDPVVPVELESPALAAAPGALPSPDDAPVAPPMTRHERVVARSRRPPVCPFCLSTETRWSILQGASPADLVQSSSASASSEGDEISGEAPPVQPSSDLPRLATKSNSALFCDACGSATPTHSDRPAWTRDSRAGDSYDRPTPRRPSPLPDGRPGWPGGLLEIWGSSPTYYTRNGIETRTDEIRGREDDELDGLVILSADRVEELDRCRLIEGPAALGKNPGIVEVAVVGLLCVFLWNAARARDGLPEAVINPDQLKPTSFQKIAGALAAAEAASEDGDGIGPTVSFTTPFTCAAAAIGSAFASAESPSLLGFGAQFSGDGNTSTPIPQGLQWNMVTCHPYRGGALRTRGEDRLLSDLGARTAIDRARVGRVVGADSHVIHEGRPLTEAELELLQLVEYGVDRGAAAKRTKAGTITPAIEAMKVEAALPLLRAPGHPTTKKEAQQMLARARKAISAALVERGMIPVPRLRIKAARAVADQPQDNCPGRPQDSDPFAVPSAIDPMGCVS